MAGVMNNTARQYNLKGFDSKAKVNVVVRLHPGFNVVKDEEWKVIKDLAFTKDLKTADKIDFGTALNKKSGEEEDASKTKATKAPDDENA